MMQIRNGIVVAALLVSVIVVGHAAAQNPAAPAPAAPAGGQGRGRSLATFPAQQRPPGDPVVSARGKTLYEMNCQSCHAADLRGSATGPNLLRSQSVLSDQTGELIAPIVRGSLANMKAIQMADEDIKAVAMYIHDVVRTARGQGAPPNAGVPVTNFVVGDAAAGKTYFEAKCSSCHSITGDLAGIGGRMPDARTLQNLWVSGGAVGGGGRRGRAAGAPDPRTPTVTVTLPSGEKAEGALVKIDDFIVAIARADGTLRSFHRDGDTPKVEVRDPLAPHRALWSVMSDKDMHDVTAYLVTAK